MTDLPGVASVLHLTETGSTQAVARALAEQGAADHTLVWADRQTRGRGRLARRWQSGPGGLYFSLILRPSFAPDKLAAFSLLTAEAAAAALSQETGLATQVKPPNDVMSGSKKLCGILAEASGGSKSLDWLVVGVGINVNNKPALKRAASLASLTGKTWDPSSILAAFLREFDRRYPPGN